MYPRRSVYEMPGLRRNLVPRRTWRSTAYCSRQMRQIFSAVEPETVCGWCWIREAFRRGIEGIRERNPLQDAAYGEKLRQPERKQWSGSKR